MSKRRPASAMVTPAADASAMPLLGEGDVVPAGEQVLQVPRGLAVAEDDERSGHDRRPSVRPPLWPKDVVPSDQPDRDRLRPLPPLRRARRVGRPVGGDESGSRRCGDLRPLHEGRDLFVVTVTDASTGSHDTKPAHWIDASIHAVELTATVAACRVLQRLVDGFHRVTTPSRGPSGRAPSTSSRGSIPTVPNGCLPIVRASGARVSGHGRSPMPTGGRVCTRRTSTATAGSCRCGFPTPMGRGFRIRTMPAS